MIENRKFWALTIRQVRAAGGRNSYGWDVSHLQKWALRVLVMEGPKGRLP